MMKRFVPAILIAVGSLIMLSGCKNDSASFSNADGNFVLFSNGTYTQTFPQAASQNDKKDKVNSLDTLPNSGTWSLIGPSDGPANSGLKVELSGVRRGYSRSFSDSYTIILDARSISGFDRVLGKQKAKSISSAP
jgi:hypothetical protein